MLKDMRGSRTDMDFMVADFENGDNAKDILAQSDKEFTVIFSKEEMEKMASDPKYYAEKMHSIEGALRMSDEINAQFGFERAFGKTNGIENSADTDTKITKFGISFNSDGTTTFFAQLEKHQLVRKNILKNSGKESCGEERGEEKEQLKQIEVKKLLFKQIQKMNFWIKLKILNGILSNQRIIKSVEDLIFNLVYLDGDDYIKYGGRFIMRKRFFYYCMCCHAFTMNVTAFAAETQEIIRRRRKQ